MTHADTNRRIAERLGWRWKRDQSFHLSTGEKHGKPWRFLIPPDSMFVGLEDANMTEEIREQIQMLPDFHSPTVFWPVFLAWCEKSGARYEIISDYTQPKQSAFRLTIGGRRWFEELPRFQTYNLTEMMEQGCRAWLAALDAMEGK